MKGKDAGKVPKWKQKLANQPSDSNNHNQVASSRAPGGKANQASVSMLQQLVLTLQIHNADYSKEDVLLNSDQFGDTLKEGDSIEVQVLFGAANTLNPAGSSSLMPTPSQQLGHSSSSNSKNGGSPQISFTPNHNTQSNLMGGKHDKRLLVRLGKDSIRQQRFQISVLKQIADLHNLKANMTCKIKILNTEVTLQPSQVRAHPINGVEKAPEQAIAAEEAASVAPYISDRVEIVFRDQLVSRRDMWKIQQFLDNKAVYKNKTLEFMGIRFTLRGLFNKDGQELFTGVVKLTHSKFFYYSKSSQVYVLIELSEEMYDFDQESGFTFNEKCIQFLKAYFERCAKSSSSHEVTIVIYSRLFYPQVKCKEELRDVLTDHYKSPKPLTDEQINQLGAFQISKHTKVFQDMYLKVGVFEIIGGGRGNWEKSLQNLKRYFNYLPSMLNWSIRCPKHVEDLKLFYPRHMLNYGANGSFISSLDEMLGNNRANNGQDIHDMPSCWVGNAEKQSILEAINLALFNLNNEEEDQNLKSTGQQLLIVTAGQGTYRINANVIEPTKSRVLLGGIPIQLISLNHKPPYKTPLLVNCCTYANPFKNNKKHTQKVQTQPQQILKAQLQAQLAGASQEGGLMHQSSSNLTQKIGKEVCTDKTNSNPPYYYPYWLDIIYLPFTKLFEVHGGTVQNPQSAIYKVQKIPPYNATNSPTDYHPLMSQAFLDSISHVEDELLKRKLLYKYQKCFEQEVEEFEVKESQEDGQQDVDEEEKIIVMQTSDYCLRRNGSMSSSEKNELIRSLEQEDALNFTSTSTTTKDTFHAHKQGQKLPRAALLQNSGSNYARRKEAGDITTRRRSYHNDQTYFIMEEGSDDGNGDEIIVIERESLASLDQQIRGGGGIQEDTPNQNRERLYTNQSNFVQSLQERTSMDDLLSHNPADPYDTQKHDGVYQTTHKSSFIQKTSEALGAKAVTVVGGGKMTHRLSYMGTASPGLTEAGAVSTSTHQKVIHYDPFSPNSKITEHTQKSPNTKHGPLQSSNSFGGSSKLKFAISPLTMSPNFSMCEPPPKGSPEAQKFKPSSLKNRWSHQAPASQVHSLFTDEELNALLHYGTFQQVEQVMESFWKSLCECKLMPLTTDYFPGEKMLKNTQKYHNELSQVYRKKMALIKGIDDYLTEYICLRLTQNFQLINQDPSPTCNIDTLAVLQRRSDIKMSMGQKYNIFTARDKENYQIMTFTKMSIEGGSEDAHAVKRADFKYMLFNFHTNKFQVKTSSESRLFSFQSLLNLSEVLYDLQMARQSCIKMPQNHFVIFFHNQSNWIFDKKAQQGPLFPTQPGSLYENQSIRTLGSTNYNNASQYMSSSFRSATVDMSLNATNSASPKQDFSTSNIQLIPSQLAPAQSIDLNSAYSANNLAQKLYQLYGAGDGPTPDDIEIEIFNQFKIQLYDMLTKNKKSQFNTATSMRSIEEIQISRQPGSSPGHLQSPYQRVEDDLYKPYEPQSMTATAYIEDDTPSGTLINGAYFFSHDNTYRPQHCFHITVSWIFANGPQIMEKINSLKRKVKSCGLQIIPISGVVNKDELNPFENFTRLKIIKSETIGSQRESSVGRGSGSAKNAGGVNSLYPYNTHKFSLDSTSYYLDEENTIPRNLYAEHLKEKRCTMFIRRFEYFLRNFYGFVIESENKIYRNYIHFSGIAVIRIFHNSEVAWIENDVVNNQMADYSESHRIQEKVDVLIYSIDLILDMVFDKILFTEEETAAKGDWKPEQQL